MAGPRVLLAPMAGVTDLTFRELVDPAVTSIAEMVTATGLAAGDPASWDLVRFPARTPWRIAQVYGARPEPVGAAARALADSGLVDEINLNVGCPMPKVTRTGGGAALPWRAEAFRAVVAALAEPGLPVSVKMRAGLDDDHLTFARAADVAADLGVRWVGLHARTARDGYAGPARWDWIAELVDHLAGSEVEVYGNGSIWDPTDAARMVAETGCSGVIIGRAALGRPWFAGQVHAALAGHTTEAVDRPGVVLAHADGLIARHGEPAGIRRLRKHLTWYGLPAPARQIERRTELAELLAHPGLAADQVSRDIPSAPRPRLALPDGWLAGSA